MTAQSHKNSTKHILVGPLTPVIRSTCVWASWGYTLISLVGREGAAMAKVEITVESLSQIVSTQGMQAAQAMISERAEALRADRARQQQSIAAAEEALKGIASQLSQLETLLIGGVKKASHDMGITLAAPDRQRPRGRHVKQAQVAEKVVGFLKSAGPDGLAKKAIMDLLAKADLTPADETVSKALAGLVSSGTILREGESKSTRYRAV
jgi:hypothetical protein